jgi:ElaA protein
MNWILKSFSQLNTLELYAILRLRCEVFVVEQNCPYLDEDNKDQTSFHLMGWDGDLLAAYTRIIPAGISFPSASIGRVVTSPQARGRGVGRQLMEESFKHLYKLFGVVNIEIGAQLYLKDFYQSLGFQQTSEVYLEDDIEHIEMIKTTSP